MGERETIVGPPCPPRPCPTTQVPSICFAPPWPRSIGAKGMKASCGQPWSTAPSRTAHLLTNEKATLGWLVLQRWRRRILEMPSMARIEDVKIRPHSFSVGMLAAEATGVTPPGVADAVLTKLAKVNHPPSAAP